MAPLQGSWLGAAETEGLARFAQGKINSEKVHNIGGCHPPAKSAQFYCNTLVGCGDSTHRAA